MATGVPSSVTQAPEQLSRAGLKRFVVDYVQGANDTELLDVAARGINAAIDRVNSRSWKWSLRRQAITLTASTAEYALNTNYKKARKLAALDASSNIIEWLDWRDPKTFLDRHSMSGSDGTPVVYTVESPKHYGKLILEPAPDSSYVASYPTLRFYYLSRVAHLSQDSDTLDVPPEVSSLVTWHARWDIALVRGLAGPADRAHAYWRELEKRLIEDDLREDYDWEQ